MKQEATWVLTFAQNLEMGVKIKAMVGLRQGCLTDGLHGAHSLWGVNEQPQAPTQLPSPPLIITLAAATAGISRFPIPASGGKAGPAHSARRAQSTLQWGSWGDAEGMPPSNSMQLGERGAARAPVAHIRAVSRACGPL